MREAKGKAFDDFYSKLDTKEREKAIYKLAKLRDRKTRDFNEVKCIKNEDSRVLVKDEEIKDRWRIYFEKLLNEQQIGNVANNDSDINRRSRDITFLRRINEDEAKFALKR